jgi:hypothetical protein
MTCQPKIDRIHEICTELSEIVESSRTSCVVPEGELILCVVHDSVQNIKRAIEKWGPRAQIKQASVEDSADTVNERKVN